MRPQSHSGISLVETLIVIAIIGILVQLTLPAIEASREAARCATCENNLRQIALASQSHTGAHGHFPSGGWTPVWVADPNRGSGEKQPGSWCYNLLPYLEESALHDLGHGLPAADQRRTGAEMFTRPLAVFTCPTRRSVQSWPFIRSGTLINIDNADQAGRSDYAASIGNLMPSDQSGKGPKSLEEADQWVVGSDPKTEWVATKHNGVVYQRSLVKPAMVTDGLSKTYLSGEKFMDPARYESGDSHGDDQSLYVGFDRDNCRSGNSLHPPMQDKNVHVVWMETGDSREITDWNFGSAHPNGMYMALCDGSVRHVGYDIEIDVHSAFSGRNDAQIQLDN